MLLQAAQRAASTQGYAGIVLEASPSTGNIDPQSLVSMYQRMGFRRTGLSERGKPLLEFGPPTVQRKTAAVPTTFAAEVRLSYDPSPAGQLPRRSGTPMAVVQRMETVKKTFWDVALTAVTAVGSAMYKYPNPIEMQQFTCCVCLVFNAAGMSNRDYKSEASREVVFESIKSNWEQHHSTKTFFDVCPFDENDELTDEYYAVMAKASKVGTRPLIVITGHCAPGSSEIQNDEGKGYDINKVIAAIRGVMSNRCTIYLTPCNTGVPGKETESFQEQFTMGMLKEADRNPNLATSETLIIGTTSVSVPAIGKILTTGQTYSRVKLKSGDPKKFGMMNEEKFLKRQNKK